MSTKFTLRADEFKKLQSDEIQRIKNEFMDAIKIMELKNVALMNKYNELKDRFDKRPPRDQDLELITRLQEELVIKEKLCREAEENMEKFRNMLLNNEENYNKYFNSNPKMGSLNLLKDKEGGAAGKGPKIEKVIKKIF
jgi:hypothetical protein